MTHYSDQRKIRQDFMFGLIRQAGAQGLTVEQLQSVMDRNYGLTGKKTSEYLKVGESWGEIETDGTKWYAKGQKPARAVAGNGSP